MSQSTTLTALFSGLVPTNLPTNQRAVLDANYIKTVSLPASAGSVNSSSLDLGDVVSGIPYATTETVNLQVVAPALNVTQLPNSATATYVIQDSADNSTFANISLLGSQVQTGAGGAGAGGAGDRYGEDLDTKINLFNFTFSILFSIIDLSSSISAILTSSTPSCRNISLISASS